MDKTLKNPKTNKPIEIGKGVFKQLLKEGYVYDDQKNELYKPDDIKKEIEFVEPEQDIKISAKINKNSIAMRAVQQGCVQVCEHGLVG